MENGIYAIQKTDTGAHAVYISQEVAEFNRQNQLTRARRKEYDHQLEIQRERRRQEAEIARIRKTTKMVAIEIALLCTTAGMFLLQKAGLISPMVVQPVSMALVGAIGYQLGHYSGSKRKKRPGKSQ